VSHCFCVQIKKVSISILAVTCLTACGPLFDFDWEKEPEVCEADSTPVSFKQVAFWSEDDSDNLALINFNQLTHINYAYLQVNADASLAPPEDTAKLEELIGLAQAEGVKVAVSFGGPDVSDTNFNTVADDSELTALFVSNVIEYLELYDLDGVDINWQFPEVGDEALRFKSLLKALSIKLNKENKFLSINIVSGEDEKLAQGILDSVFEYVDFINVMAFDSTNKDDLHSSKQDAVDAINYWTERCLIKNKLVLGVPFYSRGDRDASYADITSYADIIDESLDYACVDESKKRNYNGIATVIYKTDYALTHAGGIMIKSLQLDTYETNYSDYSLTDAIDKTVLGQSVTICP